MIGGILKSITILLLVSIWSVTHATTKKSNFLSPMNLEVMRKVVAQSVDAVVLLYMIPPGCKSSDKRVFNSVFLEETDSRAPHPAVKSGVIISANGYIVTTSNG
ncbi:MAG: hypothetical protein LBL32_01635, partial [Holosporales bacterium]|nr:hypothetical protein [Holosporales bacterium]